MINGNETIQKYETINKIYIPKNMYEETNKYTISGDTLTIITDNNCTTSYQTTYCDCTYYNIKYNLIMNSNQCNRNPSNNNLISNEYITTDINYSERIVEQYTNNYIVYFGIIITVLLFAIVMKKNGVKI